MLHLQLRVPSDLADQVVELLTSDDTVTNVALLSDGYLKPPGCLVLADVAREGANPVVAALHSLNLQHVGSIMLTEPDTLLSDAATRAEDAAPGEPDDGIVWDVVEDKVRKESTLSWAFFTFLTLATLIAGAGRLLDQPILIIGAMVVGPEFSPLAAICLALARPRLSILPGALTTLVVGFVGAIALAAPLWFVAHLLGLASTADATTGKLTSFIVQPNIWSFLIALLAGTAGVLALTTSKSGPLVGVFISVTTVPAVGTIALCIGVGGWTEILSALTQLGVNLVAIVLAGTLPFLLLRLVWARVSPPRSHFGSRR